MRDSKFSKLFGPSAPEADPEATGDAPEAAEDLGPCASEARGRWVTALTLKHAAGPWESFQYRGLCTRSEFTPTRFLVRFADEDATWEVAVTGRNLERLYTLVVQHRLDWLRAADRDYASDKEVIVLSAVAARVEAS